jgi:hypothetical protein
MTFLDKRDTVKDGIGARTDGALRSVRAKREADEAGKSELPGEIHDVHETRLADKDYRKGVHWLETLRIRRKKILEAGYTVRIILKSAQPGSQLLSIIFQSLHLFINESSETLQSVLIKYTDNLTATTTTQTHLSDHVREYIQRIQPAVDVNTVAQRMPRALASAIPAPMLYRNYVVGECNDLIFGVSLADYAQARGLQDGEIPKLVKLCIAEVDFRGLLAEGIYRVSGRHANVQEVR